MARMGRMARTMTDGVMKFMEKCLWYVSSRKFCMVLQNLLKSGIESLVIIGSMKTHVYMLRNALMTHI